MNRIKIFVGEDNSLIPKSKSYIQQRHVYDKSIRKAGYKNAHGLRHAYAQLRYQEITGFQAPIANGKSYSELTDCEKELDGKARYIISDELGHSRRSITRIYLG